MNLVFRPWLPCALALTVVGSAVACSSASTSTFNGASPDSGSDDSQSPGEFGNDAAIDAGPAPDCNPIDPTSFTPTWSPPKVSAGACTDQEMADAFDSCFATPVTEANCTEYKNAHSACFSCVSSEASDATHGPLVWEKNDYYFVLNVAGCVAIEQGDPSASSCGAAYDAAVNCKRAACDACVTSANANFASFSTCEGNAGKESTCSALNDTQSQKCGNLDVVDAATSACFEQSGETLRDLFLRVAPLFCK